MDHLHRIISQLFRDIPLTNRMVCLCRVYERKHNGQILMHVLDYLGLCSESGAFTEKKWR